MINPDDLSAALRPRYDAFCRISNSASFQVLVYCGKRSDEEQAILFRNGRKMALIKATATDLEKKWRRPDLAHILLSAPPQMGKVIKTWAAPGQSAHNYGMAFDGVPKHCGKLIWDDKTPEGLALWVRYGELIESIGLEWAGRWARKKREFPHAQVRGFDWRELISG